MLIKGLDGPTLQDASAFKARISANVNYFIRTSRTHNLYAFKYVSCEVLNLVNILFQV